MSSPVGQADVLSYMPPPPYAPFNVPNVEASGGHEWY